MKKIIKNLTLTALATVAVLAATLLFQPSNTQAGDHGQRGGDNGRGGRDCREFKSTFTKWVTAWPNMAGVVGGAVGEGVFTGEVLLYSPDPVTTKIEALYQFTGPKHSFTALVHVEQTGLKAVIIGVVTDGWLKGHAVKGEYTEGTCGDPSKPCYTGTLEIDRD